MGKNIAWKIQLKEQKLVWRNWKLQTFNIIFLNSNVDDKSNNAFS